MKTSTNPLLLMLLASILVFFSSHYMLAQEVFDLSDYKVADYKYQFLELDFNTHGSNLHSLRTRTDESDWTEIRSRVSGSIAPSYFRVKNTRAYQGSQNISMNFAPQFQKNTFKVDEDQSSVTTQQSVNFTMLLSSVNRYYDSKQRFLAPGLRMYFSAMPNSNSMKDSYPDYQMDRTTRQRDNILQIQMPLMIGKGRIEEVQDARLAVYILEDLQKSGDLSRKPEHNEILELAAFITQVKTQRYFDHRLRRISEITAIDSMLHVMGLKAGTGASYYTLLNDKWAYAAGPVRESGYRVSVGIVPAYSWRVHKYIRFDNNNTASVENKLETENQKDNLDVEFNTGFVWEKPVKLAWQHSTNISASYIIKRGNEKYLLKSSDSEPLEDDSKLKTSGFYFAGSQAIGYYPNSRTHLRLAGGVSFNHWLKWPESLISGNHIENEYRSILQSEISFLCNYYISPQLQFSIAADIIHFILSEKNQIVDLNKQSDYKLRNYALHFWAGFRYSIF